MVRDHQELPTPSAIDLTLEHSSSNAIPRLTIAVLGPDSKHRGKLLDQPRHSYERLTDFPMENKERAGASYDSVVQNSRIKRNSMTAPIQRANLVGSPDLRPHLGQNSSKPRITLPHFLQIIMSGSAIGRVSTTVQFWPESQDCQRRIL